MTEQTLSTVQSVAPRIPAKVIEPGGSGLKPKMYINSVAVSEKGTWLVSFTRADYDNAAEKFVPERIFVRRSEDCGHSWDERVMVYDGQDRGARQAEMGQLTVIPHMHRIYQFSIRHTGVRFGELVFTYSEDDGKTWIGPEGTNSAFTIPVPPYSISPHGNSNHLMAKGMFMSNGEYILPLAVASDPEALGDIEAETVFLICYNIASENDPTKLKFRFYPEGPCGIRVPKANNPQMSLAQEPHVVQFSNDTLMTTMRTGQGCIYYSTSRDFGRTWAKSEPLRYSNGGKIIRHPNAPCPFVKLKSGKFLLFHHNNSGDVFGSRDVFDYQKNRRPIYVCVGRELPEAAGQPIMFTDSRILQDSDGIPAGYMNTTECSCYSGVIENDKGVYYIYGNKWSQIEVIQIPAELLDDSCLH